MGLDDRDYMRERYRKRQGLGPDGTTWNDKRARREHALGDDGAWFAAKNRGFDYRKGRYRASPANFKPHPLQGWILLLSAIAIAIPAYRRQRERAASKSSIVEKASTPCSESVSSQPVEASLARTTKPL